MKLNHDISQEEFELIEAYLNNQLNSKDLEEFEQRLKNEDNFKIKVDDIKTILLGIETQVLKEQLNVFHEVVNSEDTFHIKKEDEEERRIPWIYMAIAAMLIIALGSFWFLRTDSNENLYASYFTPDPGLPTTMSSQGNYEFYRAMVDYKQRNYNTAIASWQTQLLAKPENDTLNYFIGVAQMANKNEVVSIESLQKVTEASASTFKSEAYFYLGLAYLKTGDQAQAIQALKKSSLPESAELLKKLD